MFFWDSDGVEHSVTEENKESWYHYLAQTGTEDGKTSRWANAKTEDGSYWVWIPRFEYQLDEKSQSILVNFIDTSQTTASNGYKSTLPLKMGVRTERIITTKMVSGTANCQVFWVAKYEMSDNSGVPASVSGVTSWRNISIEDSYHKSQSIASKVEGLNPNVTDSHLMKNSEWGAVAYLSHSAYGRNGAEITVNTDNSYIEIGIVGLP